MTIEDAYAWIAGERSMTNMIPDEPYDTWLVRIAQADAAATQQAYWLVRAHKDDQDSILAARRTP